PRSLLTLSHVFRSLLCWFVLLVFFFFFFQAEDGIRDRNVTGVQTCALPILASLVWVARVRISSPTSRGRSARNARAAAGSSTGRSEERRVGKECRSRWAPYQ